MNVGNSFDGTSPKALAGSLVTPVAGNVLGEIQSMKGALGRFASPVDFENLEQTAIASLARIERLIAEGKIRPQARIRHSADAAQQPFVEQELRIGVFPTSANPFHWAHLIGGLVAMERFHLDKVIFVIAGRDSRKPGMAPEEARHSMARRILQLFHPLFEYSSIARGTSTPGEDHVFTILRMNPAQPMHVFYIAGGDHYHRFHPVTGNPDTIQRLELGMSCRIPVAKRQWHRVTAVFLHRGDNEERNITTFLDVQHVSALAVQTSSSEIRTAFEDRRRWQRLYTLPFGALLSICGSSLYRIWTCTDFLDELRPHLAGARSGMR